VRRHYSGEVVSLEFSSVKFPQDSVYQTLLKSVHFSPSYSKYKKADVFVTQCISQSEQ